MVYLFSADGKVVYLSDGQVVYLSGRCARFGGPMSTSQTARLRRCTDRMACDDVKP
jgi:hypothetical protein